LVAFSQGSDSGNITEHQYVVEREFTTENGLPANGTNGMYQDSKGYIWAATYNGLVRYNGLEFKIYNSSSIGNLESNRFTAVSEDLEGNIWAGLEQDGFIKIDMDSDSVYTYSLDRQVSTTNIKTTSFNFTSDNSPWIGTSSGLFTIQDGEVVHLEKLPGKYVNRLLINHESIYVVYTNEIIQLNPDNYDDLLTIAELRNDVVYFQNDSLTQIDNVTQFMDLHFINNELYLITEAGLVRYNEEAELLFSRDDVNQAALHGFLPHNDELLVYGRDGIFSTRLSELDFTYYNRTNVIDLMIDHEGSLWAASMANGIIQFVSTPVYLGSDFDELDDQGITGILKSSDDTVYVGANCDGIYKFDANDVQRFGSENGLGNECVWSLMEESNGNLWSGTWGAGVYFSEPGSDRFERFNPPIFEDVSVFLSIFEDSNGSIWFGTYSNGLFKSSNTETIPITDSEGETLAAVRMIFESQNGDIFVATDEGVGRLQGDEIDKFESISALGLSSFRTIAKDNSGRFWFGSYGAGLIVYEPGEEPEVISTEDGLFDNTISQLSFDEDGDLWLGGNLGVFFIKREQVESYLNGDDDQLRVSRIGVSEGMTIRETNGGFMPSSQLTENGELLIPTVQGVNVINTHRMERNEEPPNSYIEQIEIDGESYQPAQLESIPYSAQRVIFRYAGLSFKNPEYNRYEYMLEGFDEDWLSAGNNGEAVYSRIPAGDYSFKVRASNNDNVWSTQAASISFSVEPPFWQSVWFFLGILVLSGIIIVAAFRYRLRSIKKYNRQLEQKVEERTDELRVSNEELKKHIEEKNKLQSILAHDLRNPFSAILGYIELIKNEFEQKGEQEQVEMMNMLLDSGRNTLALLENLLQWSSSKEGGLETKFEIIDITDLVDEAISMTDAQSTFKNIFVRNLIDEAHYVWADRNMILSVIRNLFSNAIKFSGRDSIVEISLEEKDEKVVISVEDSGVGISEEEQDKLFSSEKMQQKVGTQGEKGIGMGLMLCKEFIDKHDEAIWVSSAPKKGSTFSFSLQKATKQKEKPVDKPER